MATSSPGPKLCLDSLKLRSTSRQTDGITEVVALYLDVVVITDADRAALSAKLNDESTVIHRPGFGPKTTETSKWNMHRLMVSIESEGPH